MAIAESLKRFRTELGLSQKAVAETLGKSQQAYSQYEFKNNPKSPSVDVVIKLANTYNVSADYLLGLTDNPTPHAKRQIQVENPNNKSNELANLRSELDKIKYALADSGIKI